MDEHFMRAALAMARRGLGTTWPNPSVGCVLVADGRVVGAATTALGGRPHAEAQALDMAGKRARGATAFVTLEPCSHVGGTPPCADALVAAGVARVAVGAGDPDPRVNGAGVAGLRAAGVAVTEGVLKAEAEAVLAGYLMRVRAGRPLVTLKLASTLDGRIATAGGESRWITGAGARREVHALRGRHDAVMVGVGTVLADDPDLTCRLPGYCPRPGVRIVMDSRLRTPLESRLVAGAGAAPTWLLHGAGADPGRVAALGAAGARCIEVAASCGSLDPGAALRVLAGEGLTSILLEGGAALAAAFLGAALVDRLAWFHAPGTLGGDAVPAIQALDVADLARMPRFTRLAIRPLGADLLTEFVRTAEGVS